MARLARDTAWWVEAGSICVTLEQRGGIARLVIAARRTRRGSGDDPMAGVAGRRRNRVDDDFSDMGALFGRRAGFGSGFVDRCDLNSKPDLESRSRSRIPIPIPIPH